MAEIKSSGSTEAIRDWLNASLYNKEEIDDLFIRNNQSGLIPYDLMITGDQPEQMIKLVGQTSGKTYNICLTAILGDDMKETVLYENSGSTNPQTITLNDDWSKYTFIAMVSKLSGSGTVGITSMFIPVSCLKKIVIDGGLIGAIFNNELNSDNYVVYNVNSGTNLTFNKAKNYVIDSILGYK